MRALDRSRRPATYVAFACFALVATAVVVWPLVLAAVNLDGGGHVVLRQSVLPAALLCLVLLVAARHAQRWARPVRRMARTLAEVRAGEFPLDDMAAGDDASPEWAALVAQIERLCHDLKSQQQLVRRLESEVNRRVVARTDSLERQLGTLRHKANRDALTGLSNRGAFDRIFPALVEKARRGRSDLCVVMIDVDYFKALNDTLGHAAGDELLRKIGQLIRGAVRDGDEAFRYGGDEFVLLLWDTTASRGRATADRLSRLVQDLCKPFGLPNAPRLTCGVCTLADRPDAAAADLLKRADDDLYRLKKARKTARAA